MLSHLAAIGYKHERDLVSKIWYVPPDRDAKREADKLQSGCLVNSELVITADSDCAVFLHDWRYQGCPI